MEGKLLTCAVLMWLLPACCSDIGCEDMIRGSGTTTISPNAELDLFVRACLEGACSEGIAVLTGDRYLQGQVRAKAGVVKGMNWMFFVEFTSWQLRS